MAPRISLAQGRLGVLVGIGVGVGFAALGLTTAPVAALVSRMCWRPGPVTVPYGLVMSVAASMAVVFLAGSVSRGYALLAAAAWILGLAYVVNGTSGGSFVIASDGLGWGFLVLGTVATMSTALWGVRRS